MIVEATSENTLGGVLNTLTLSLPYYAVIYTDTLLVIQDHTITYSANTHITCKYFMFGSIYLAEIETEIIARGLTVPPPLLETVYE